MSEITEKDRAIMEALEAQREEQMSVLRNGYRAVRRFHTRMYQANRQLMAEAWEVVVKAFAGRYEIWAQYATLLGKDSVDDLTEEELIRALAMAKPAWPWEDDEENLSDQ